MSENTQKESDEPSKAVDKDVKATKNRLVQEKTDSRAKAQLGNNIEIDPQSPLPGRNVGPIKAYVASGYGDRMGNFFALVCEKHLVPRLKAVSVYKGFTNPMLTKLVDCGVVYWPPARAERYVFVYNEDGGSRLLDLQDDLAMGLSQDEIMDAIVKPMVQLLQDFRDSDFFHGSINPHNMYSSRGTQKLGRVSLGDCLCAPPSYNQPALYEPIERAMADPIARGRGTQADDLYALGVSLCVILRTNDPLLGLSNDDVIKRKIEVGSYSAITGKDRFKGSILELLRGVLLDDPSQRWTIEEVLAWLDGRRLSPKQSTVAKKAPRPLPYLDKKYFNLRLLAMDIDKNPAETLKIIETDELHQWLERSLEDSKTIQRVEEAQQNAKEMGAGPTYQYRLVANLSSALDPMGPIRYQGMNLGGEGVGTALAQAVSLNKETGSFADIFQQKVAMNWVTAQENPFLDVGVLVSRYDSCSSFLRHKKAGFGIERCLYMLCPEAPCYSEKLKNYYVTSPEQMVEAFENLCEKGDAPAFFLDRHSMAFLSVKDSKCIDSQLYELSTPEEHRKILGNLKTLASIQKRSSMPPLPAIARTFMDMMPIIYKRYHDQQTIEKIDKDVKRLAASGDLVKMVGLLDNPDIINKDFNSFKFAMAEYESLRKELAFLERRLEDKNSFGRVSGGQFSSIVSSVLACLIIFFMTFMYMSDK